MTENGKITCTIDGTQVTVPKGTLIIEAAAEAGVYIPRFCYHKLLKPYGGCRMCLVDITKGSDRDPRPFPKPEPACMHTVQDGMEVRTDTERVHAVREGVMELTLINHPLDCPICDQGGECDLQDLAYLYGREDSRFHETKIFKLHRELSSLIAQDYNRCIQCKRCVRWTEEVADDDRLVFKNRGAKTQVATFNGQPFVSRFGGMTIELCPVGALTSSVFRFKARSWEVSSARSTCSECALGCDFQAQYRGDRIMRFISPGAAHKPGAAHTRVFELVGDDSVNGPYFCDRGRFAHDYLEHPDRLVRPIRRSGDGFESIGWDDAAEMLAQSINRVIQKDGPRAVAACIDPVETLETLWTFRRLFRDGFSTPRIEHAPAPLGLDPDDIPGLFSRLATVDRVLSSKNLVLLESDPFDEAPVLGLRLKLAWEQGGIDGVSISPVQSYLGKKGFDERLIPPHRMRAVLAGIVAALADRANVVPDELGPVLDAARNATSGLRQDERQAVQAAVARLRAPDAVLVVGTPPLRSRCREITALWVIASLREAVTGNPLPILPMFRNANSLAAMLIGLRTQLLKGPEGPGAVGFTGESVLDWPEEIENGKIGAMFAVGDGLIEAIGTTKLDRLGSLEFLAVVTDFMNPLAARADLVIPRLAPWEQSGTLISLDGRIGRVEQVVPHPAGAWPLDRFLREVGKHVGPALPRDAAELGAEMAEARAAFRPLVDGGDRLERPNPVAFRFGEARHAFDPGPPPDGNRFGVIIAETIFRHDTRGEHSEHIAAMPEDFCCGMNRKDAARLGTASGDRVRLRGETGELSARVKIVEAPRGYVLIPAGFSESPLGELDLWRDPDIRVAVDLLPLHDGMK